MAHILLSVLLLSLILPFNAASEPQSIFEPLDHLQTPIGQKLLQLHTSSEASPVEALTEVDALKTTGKLDSIYYQWMYYRILHSAYTAQSDLERTAKAATDFYQFGVDNKAQWIMAEALSLKAIDAAKRSDDKEAMSHISQAIILSENSHYRHLVPRLLNTRGVLYSRTLHYNLSLQDYQKAISLLVQNPNEPYLSKLYSNISVVYSRLKDWRHAEFYNQKAIDLYFNLKQVSPELLVVLYTNASNYKLELNDLSAAQDLSDKVMAIAEENQSQQLMMNALWTEVELLVKQKKYDKARVQALECQRLSVEVTNPILGNRCLVSLGKIYFEEARIHNQPEKLIIAAEYVQQAMVFYKAFDYRDSLLSGHQLLSDIFRAQGEFEKAIVHLEIFYSETQQNLFDEREAQIYELQEKFETKVKEDQITLLTAANELKATSLETKEMMERFWMVLIVFFILLGVYFIYRFKASEKRNRRLSLSNNELLKTSNHDSLTGLFNRRHLENIVSHDLVNRVDEAFSVLMIDCDYFKNINDTYGHEIGDEVLRAIASRLNGCIGSNDLLARWGGEEFVVLMSCSLDAPIGDMAQKIRDDINNHIVDTKVGDLSLTVSIGVSIPQSPEQLTEHWLETLSQADKALYKAKGAGRNCVVVAPLPAY